MLTSLVQFADAVGRAMKDTELARQMTTQPWLWPTCETLHFIGLALLIGVAGAFDLRLLGLLKKAPLKALLDMRGWAVTGLVINLVTGLMFLAGAPEQYLHNRAWWWKVLFLFIALLNILVFELNPRTKALIATIGPGDDTPMSFKVAGGVSIFSWFAVMYWGRMLPFIGNAF